MAAQALLFEAGRPGLPPRVTVFASGANEAREIRGFRLAGIPIGVAVSHVREAAINELLSSPSPVFADSGAFSEVAVDSRGMHVVAPSHMRSGCGGWRSTGRWQPVSVGVSPWWFPTELRTKRSRSLVSRDTVPSWQGSPVSGPRCCSRSSMATSPPRSSIAKLYRPPALSSLLPCP